jgi:hypothetical protein
MRFALAEAAERCVFRMSEPVCMNAKVKYQPKYSDTGEIKNQRGKSSKVMYSC